MPSPSDMTGKSARVTGTAAGLMHLTKSLAMECMHQPIRFNVVAPDGMMTALAAGCRHLQDADAVGVQTP